MPGMVIRVKRGWIGLLVAQFLGAFNDNILRFLIVFFILARGDRIGDQAQIYIALSGALFTVPFLLFSSLAGQWADSQPKYRVLFMAKTWELPIMILASVGIYFGLLWLLLVALFFTASQASFFGPAKYAVISELVEPQALSRANGWIGGTTFAGILLGALLAGWLADLEMPLISSFVLIGLACLGILACFAIGITPSPAMPTVLRLNPFKESWELVRGLRDIPLAWVTAWLISYLWFLGALLQLLLPLFGEKELALGATQTQSLLVAAAIGIVVGCLVMGRLSGVRIWIKGSKLGLWGMGISTFLLGISSPSYPLAFFALFILGLTGGFFIIPLYARMQWASPSEKRGRIIAANNLLNTFALFAASLLLYITGLWKIEPSYIILGASLLSFLVAGWMMKLR